MLSRSTRTVILVALLVLACAATQFVQPANANPAAGTLTITLNGKLGPILSGMDPLGLNGHSGKLTVKASESLNPKKHNANSATYVLPAGAITVQAGNNRFTTTKPSSMIITLGSSADTLVLQFTGPQGIQITDTNDLKTGSWTTKVLKHPTPFSPSPQNLKAAKSANGPGSKLKYTIQGSSTVLGFTGTAANKG